MPEVKRYTPRGLNVRNNLLARDPSYATEVKNVQVNNNGDLIKRDGIETKLASPANMVELVASSFDFNSDTYGEGANKLVFINGAKVPKVLKANDTLVDAEQGWRDYSFIHQHDYATAGHNVQFTSFTIGNYFQNEMIFAQVYYTSDDGGTAMLYVYAKGIYFLSRQLAVTTSEQIFTDHVMTIKVKILDTTTDQWNRIFLVQQERNSSGISCCEYNENIYIANKSSIAPLFKFDKTRYYCAGICSPAGLLGDRTTYPWMRLYDLNTTTDFYVLQMFDIAARSGKAFYPFGYFNKSDGVGERITNYFRLVYRITNNANENPIYSDYFFYGALTNNIGTTVDIEYALPFGGYFNENAFKLELLIFQSNALDYGYVLTKEEGVPLTASTYITKTTEVTLQDISSSYYNEPMENFIDTDVGYSLPPFAKFVSARHNALLVIDNYDNVNWSSQALNASVENFSALNYEVLGRGTNGGITAIFSGSNKDIVFKKDCLYFLDGNITDNYNIRKSVSNLLGALHDKSVLALEGGVIFCTMKGIYGTYNGEEPQELSDLIEPLFENKGYDFSTARSVLDPLRERFMVYVSTDTNPVESYVIVFNYKYKEWFIFEGIDASLGFVLDNKKEIYFANSTSICKLDPTSNKDDGTAISSYWKSGWENLGEPSLRKKFLNLKLFSLSDVDWTATISSEINWVEGTPDTKDQTITLNSDNRFYLHNLNNNLCYSMRFIIENNAAEDILLTGYEYEVEAVQKKIKG